MMHAFPFCYEFLLFHWHQSNIQEYSTVCVLHHCPPKCCTNTFLSLPLSLSPTHRARLLVQEDVCSAHFNMNIIILYLAAIRFSCHKPTQASSFFLLQNTARQKSRSFPHHNWNVIMLKKKKRERTKDWVGCNIYFWWPWKKICEWSQYLTFATLHKWRSNWRPDLYLSPSFCFRLSYILKYLSQSIQRHWNIKLSSFHHR